MKGNDPLVNELEVAIHSILNNCDSAIMPTICAMRSSAIGKEKIVAEVTNRVAKAGVSILDALHELETEFNNNKIED